MKTYYRTLLGMSLFVGGCLPACIIRSKKIGMSSKRKIPIYILAYCNAEARFDENAFNKGCIVI
jgi:hypothetical protein